MVFGVYNNIELSDGLSQSSLSAGRQLPFACIVDSSHDDSSFDAQTAMGIVYTSTDHLMPYHTMATLPYQSSDFSGHPELQFDLKSAPRLDTRIDSIALDYDAFSASTSSWSLSPLSGSIDGGHFYPINAQENPSPPLTKSENVFVSGLPCYNETDPDKADGRQVSVSNDDYLPVHATACLTISPESLESSSGQELPEQPDYLDDSKLRMETFVQPKRQVATPKVLAASRRRRGQIKQGIELLDCELCGETFTAKHNLITWQIIETRTMAKSLFPVTGVLVHLARNMSSKGIKRDVRYFSDTKTSSFLFLVVDLDSGDRELHI
ncbi:hypothetical protein FB446DRAFT_700548 [Lentinula raphanica]|nr:hypothetical protein FB446DRAFT_700548 [Lentinula raphanica]